MSYICDTCGDPRCGCCITLDAVLTQLKSVCDRDWTDETPLQVATILTNSLVWARAEGVRLPADEELDAQRAWETLE